RTHPAGPERALDAAAALLCEAERPALLVGAGALGAGDLVATLSERLGAPIVHAYLGKAVVPSDHPNHMGGTGLLGDRPGVLAMEQCDALLIVGSSFPYLSYYPQPGKARAAQIDLDPERIGLRYPVEVALPGDARATGCLTLPATARGRGSSSSSTSWPTGARCCASRARATTCRSGRSAWRGS